MSRPSCEQCSAYPFMRSALDGPAPVHTVTDSLRNQNINPDPQDEPRYRSSAEINRIQLHVINNHKRITNPVVDLSEQTLVLSTDLPQLGPAQDLCCMAHGKMAIPVEEIHEASMPDILTFPQPEEQPEKKSA